VFSFVVEPNGYYIFVAKLKGCENGRKGGYGRKKRT
jgi:hypothetical protein